MIATYYPDDDVKAVFMEVLLDPEQSFWRRLIYSWRYIWCPSRRSYGNFTEVILTEDHLPSLRRLVNYLQKSGNDNATKGAS